MSLEGVGVQDRGRLKRKLEIGGAIGGGSYVGSLRSDPGEASPCGPAFASFWGRGT